MSEVTPKIEILTRLNALSTDDARDAFTRCCGAQTWVAALLTRRPFATWDTLESASTSAFQTLTNDDWREAFSHHPQIGDINALRARFQSTRQWASGEQSGTSVASEQVLRDLADGNQAYRARFGYIFIVCATGKTAEEMLTLLRTRLPNDPQTEIVIAAREQQKITALRLRKL